MSTNNFVKTPLRAKDFEAKLIEPVTCAGEVIPAGTIVKVMIDTIHKSAACGWIAEASIANPDGQVCQFTVNMKSLERKNKFWPQYQTAILCSTLPMIAPEGFPARFNELAQAATQKAKGKYLYTDGQRVTVLQINPLGFARVTVVSTGDTLVIPSCWLRDFGEPVLFDLRQQPDPPPAYHSWDYLYD